MLLDSLAELGRGARLIQTDKMAWHVPLTFPEPSHVVRRDRLKAIKPSHLAVSQSAKLRRRQGRGRDGRGRPDFDTPQFLKDRRSRR